MDGLRFAPGRAGLATSKALCAILKIDPAIYSKALHGKVNLTPRDFRRVCSLSGMRPEEVACFCDVDYGIKPPPKRKEKRIKSEPIRWRATKKQKALFLDDLEVMGYPTIQSFGDHIMEYISEKSARIKAMRANADFISSRTSIRGQSDETHS